MTKPSTLLENASCEELMQEISCRLKKIERCGDGERNRLVQELNLVNRKLVESETLKTNFLSNIRNEIVNPLTAALELSSSISSDEMDLQKVKRLSVMVHREIMHLNFQLRNILCSAAIEAGEMAFSYSVIQPVRLIQNILDTLESEMSRKEIHLECNHHISAESNFYSDGEKLHLILENILSNAVRFNRHGGTIHVETALLKEGLQITISDSGIGMNDEDKRRVFDRFTQIEEGLTKPFPGHGLGLSVAKALLELLEGQVNVDSVLNEGSRFTLLVPEANSAEGNTAFSGNGNDLLFTEPGSEIF